MVKTILIYSSLRREIKLLSRCKVLVSCIP
jgi:hypothetical protein